MKTWRWFNHLTLTSCVLSSCGFSEFDVSNKLWQQKSWKVVDRSGSPVRDVPRVSWWMVSSLGMKAASFKGMHCVKFTQFYTVNDVTVSAALDCLRTIASYSYIIPVYCSLLMTHTHIYSTYTPAGLHLWQLCHGCEPEGWTLWWTVAVWCLLSQSWMQWRSCAETWNNSNPVRQGGFVNNLNDFDKTLKDRQMSSDIGRNNMLCACSEMTVCTALLWPSMCSKLKPDWILEDVNRPQWLMSGCDDRWWNIWMWDVQAEAADLSCTRVEHAQGGTFIHTTATWLPSAHMHVGSSI